MDEESRGDMCGGEGGGGGGGWISMDDALVDTSGLER